MSNSYGKHFYNITEVAEKLNLPTHILRFWEQKFSQISPRKNNNRRLYREEDIKILETIKFLLYEKGYTIKGVQKYFEESDDKLIPFVTTQPAPKNNEKKNQVVNIEEVEILLEKLRNMRNFYENLRRK